MRKLLSKPLSWWLLTPLYAVRHVRHRLGMGVRANAKSANNEDKVIAAFLDQKVGYCVEVGALDGIQGSNTLFFERRGWKCLLVEADPEMARSCKKNRKRAFTVSAAAVAPQQTGPVNFEVVPHNRAMSSLSFDASGENHFKKHGTEFSTSSVQIEGRTVDSMLEAAGFPIVDFITIDVEGHELNVLKGFDLDKWKPRIIMLERIQHIINPEIAEMMDKHGYKHVLSMPLGASEDCNDFYFKERL